MLKKELFDTIKTLGQCLLVLLIIPIALMLKWNVFHSSWEVTGIFQPVSLAFVILFASFSGVSIFQSEKRERALEYLLALPVSYSRILATKILPRLGILLVLIIIGGIAGVFQSFLIDAVNLIVLFLVAVAISLAVESLIIAMIGVLLVNVILYQGSVIFSYLLISNQWMSDTSAVAFAQAFFTVVMLVPLLAGFLLTVRQMDYKPIKWQAKSYLLISLPAVFIMITFILVFIKKYLIWIRGTA